MVLKYGSVRVSSLILSLSFFPSFLSLLLSLFLFPLFPPLLSLYFARYKIVDPRSGTSSRASICIGSILDRSRSASRSQVQGRSICTSAPPLFSSRIGVVQPLSLVGTAAREPGARAALAGRSSQRALFCSIHWQPICRSPGPCRGPCNHSVAVSTGPFFRVPRPGRVFFCWFFVC